MERDTGYQILGLTLYELEPAFLFWHLMPVFMPLPQSIASQCLFLSFTAYLQLKIFNNIFLREK